MTAHELARKLLEGPDLPVAIPGYEMNGDDPIDHLDRALAVGTTVIDPKEHPYWDIATPVAAVVIR